MTMPKIMEGTIFPIISLIQAGMPAQLAEFESGKSDSRVNLTNFVDYLIYPKAIGLRTPCVFVIGRTVEYLQPRGQNHINAKVHVQVNAVFQDRTAELLTLMAWRYHDILHKILDQAHIVSLDQKAKNIINVISSEFGDLVQVKEQTESPFRTEVMLTLEVEHYESEN